MPIIDTTNLPDPLKLVYGLKTENKSTDFLSLDFKTGAYSKISSSSDPQLPKAAIKFQECLVREYGIFGEKVAQELWNAGQKPIKLEEAKTKIEEVEKSYQEQLGNVKIQLNVKIDKWENSKDLDEAREFRHMIGLLGLFLDKNKEDT